MTIEPVPTSPAVPPILRRRHAGLTTLLAIASLALVLVLAACGDDDDNSDNVASCGTQALPVADDANGPVLTDVALQCQEDALNLLVTITDPQGSADLASVNQVLIVYDQADCKGTVEFEVTGIVVESGVEANFGQFLNRTTDETLFEEICGAEEWPVEIHLYDDSGHHTFGKVMARLAF